MTPEQGAKQDAALAWAIKMFPLDLAARINYIHVRQDRCELSELFAWQYAERITHRDNPVNT